MGTAKGAEGTTLGTADGAGVGTTLGTLLGSDVGACAAA